MPAISAAITIRASEWTNPPRWHGCWHGSTACRAGKGFSSHTCPLQAITPMPLRSTVPSRERQRSINTATPYTMGTLRSALSSKACAHEGWRSEEHTSELQSHHDLVCRLLLEKKKK